MKRIFALFFFGFFLHFALLGQPPIPGLSGSISGQVKDSIDMSNLSEATVAIYLKQDSSLIKYRLNDTRGRFKIPDLPLGTDLILVVSYIGFNSFVYNFKLTEMARDLTAKNILLVKSSVRLNEVVIRQPPMVMRGDTVEFNVGAFKARKNAVIGDLMKELPGFIIWGDGKITVNGKAVSQVLVEGKVFFSGDSRISLGNIPKEVVSKVQVIPDEQDPSSYDTDTLSTVTVNLALKKGMKSALFGKIGYGHGSDGKREGDVVISSYSPSAQFSLAGNLNNVNKLNSTVGEMMVEGAYRSIPTTKTLYQSDFRRLGVDAHHFGGALYNRDWSANSKSLTEYTGNDDEDRINQHAQERTLLSDSAIVRSSSSINVNKRTRHRLSNTFEIKDSIYNTIVINTVISKTHSNSAYVDSSLTNSSRQTLINKSSTKHESSTNNSMAQVGFNYMHNGRPGKSSGPSKQDFEVQYEFEKNSSDSQTSSVSDLQSQANEPLKFNRDYLNETDHYSHHLYAEYKNLNWLLGAKSELTDIKFQSEIDYNKTILNSNVMDLDASEGESFTNNYLSTDNRMDLLMFKPRSYIHQTFLKAMPGRWVKSLQFYLVAQTQHYLQRNRSDKGFRNVTNNYVRFLPEASITLSARKVSNRRHSIMLGYVTESEIPGIDQLSPLIDSTLQNQYFLGNAKLKDTYGHQFTFQYHWMQEVKNGADLSATFTYNSTRDYISDSLFFNSQGVKVIYPVNIDGYHTASADIKLSKPFQIGKNLITWVISGSFAKTVNPVYIGHQLQRSDLNSVNLNSEIGYLYKDVLGIQLRTWYNSYHTQLAIEQTGYKVKYFGSGLQVSLNWPKRFYMISSTNADFNQIEGIRSANLLIWNIQVSYRFSSAEQFEIKLSGNDILNQNVNISNTIINNTVAYFRSNSLKRYFMVSFSYFPRFFSQQKTPTENVK